MKGYWIARIDVTDEALYPEYGKRAVPAIAKFGGRLLARGGRATTPEGRAWARNVVIELASHEQALATRLLRLARAPGGTALRPARDRPRTLHRRGRLIFRH